jgi:nucleoside-diphosphate-sugar epimerase
MTKKVVVTGANGKVGRPTVYELLDHGYQVLPVDRAPFPDPKVPSTVCNLDDFGSTWDLMNGVLRRMESGPDAVIHLAAGLPGKQTNAYTFHTNMLAKYNVFESCARLGIKRVVWASSETILGQPFDQAPPPYVPLDEEPPARTEVFFTGYALSKILGEVMARQFVSWYPDMTFVGLRIGNVRDAAAGDYEEFRDWHKDIWARKWNLWGYVDSRDVAQACRLAVEAPIIGADVFIVAAGDTVMTTPNRKLMKTVFPDVEIKRGTGDFDTLLSIRKAREILGYEPRYSWRDILGGKKAAASKPKARAGGKGRKGR